ncbi:hypothetical protein [Paenibacillus hexagrammi]|uniref:DUF4025 domain-containing protein n=1 Tax=Paenibacillus hexagrammi TaxID=2908839 RepID=A0ABY3SGC8_9BACL|nr:hypothetical protein [Paenibacillus sp. YPD9-1]UJF32981.1 hypothetical protein L0M14_25955 [Paenibacillus sp. YPD9-1]
MSQSNETSAYRPDVTNYDYVWNSDQDEYIKSAAVQDSVEQQAAEEQTEQ